MTYSDDIDPHERLARQLDWNLLRIFIAIVQYGGISRAAEHVHLSQPAISQSLKRLETQLGAKLIERNTRHFDITESGRRIYTKALEIHAQISRLSDVASAENNNVYGHLRLLFASRIKSRVLDNLLQQFHRHYPAITIRIDVLPSTEIQTLIQQGLASAGFCIIRNQSQDIETKLLLSQNFGLYCSFLHPLYGRSDLSPEDLSNEDLITFPSDQIGGVLSPLTIFREQHTFEGRVIATSYNLDEVVRLTKLGIGISTLPIHFAESMVKDNQLWQLPPAKGIGPIDLNLIWNTAAEMSPAEQAFLEFAQAHLETSNTMGSI